MVAYSELVNQILKVPALAEEVQRMASDPNLLNLVTPDWQQHLENNVAYQDFQKNCQAMYDKERSSNNQFRIQTFKENVVPIKVILAAYCNVYRPFVSKVQPFSITVHDSPVLALLGQTLTSDVDSSTNQLLDLTKLSFKACNMCCQYCSGAMNDMSAKGIKIHFDAHQPCIVNTRVYDGKTIVNRFAGQISDYFQGAFIGIFEMEINQRYFYPLKTGKSYCVRIGGTADNLIAFPESNLKESKLSLGDLTLVAQTQQSLTQHVVALKNDSNQPQVGEKRSSDEEEDEVINVIPVKKQKTSDNSAATGYEVAYEGAIEFN